MLDEHESNHNFALHFKCSVVSDNSLLSDSVMSSFFSPPLQVCGHGFHAGDLGPGTIVGSAAFNMFVIIGICVWTIPTGESRKIKHLRVFFITAFWSIFAYIWLYLILSVMSPGVVEVRRTHIWSLSHKHEAEHDRRLSRGWSRWSRWRSTCC